MMILRDHLRVKDEADKDSGAFFRAIAPQSSRLGPTASVVRVQNATHDVNGTTVNELRSRRGGGGGLAKER